MDHIILKSHLFGRSKNRLQNVINLQINVFSIFQLNIIVVSDHGQAKVTNHVEMGDDFDATLSKKITTDTEADCGTSFIISVRKPVNKLIKRNIHFFVKLFPKFSVFK